MTIKYVHKKSGKEFVERRGNIDEFMEWLKNLEKEYGEINPIEDIDEVEE